MDPRRIVVDGRPIEFAEGDSVAGGAVLVELEE